MELNQRLDQLEDEIKILKNEIQQSLLDIREHVLTKFTNPFRPDDYRPASLQSSEQAPTKTERETVTTKEEIKKEQPAPESHREDSSRATSELQELIDKLRQDREALEHGGRDREGPIGLERPHSLARFQARHLPLAQCPAPLRPEKSSPVMAY